jgi:hypothetical protein
MMQVGIVAEALVALVAAGVLELPQAAELAAEITAVLVELGAAASALVVEAAAETIYL